MVPEWPGGRRLESIKKHKCIEWHLVGGDNVKINKYLKEDLFKKKYLFTFLFLLCTIFHFVFVMYSDFRTNHKHYRLPCFRHLFLKMYEICFDEVGWGDEEEKLNWNWTRIESKSTSSEILHNYNCMTKYWICNTYL